MTTIELYRKHKAGEIGRDRFLYEVRRDNNLPWITNVTSYDDAVKILKNKGIISEARQENVATDPAVDRVNPYFLKKGVEKMLSKEKELTNDSYINALNKAAKQLENNPHAFDEDMFANAKEVEKADAKLVTQEVKKANHKDKANEMKKAKVKSLKESVIEDLINSLKKKDLINEDSHWNYTVGSEVHTPDGPGKVSDIVGGTLSIEFSDGSCKDYQVNIIDKCIADKEKEMDQSFDSQVDDFSPYERPENTGLLERVKELMEKYKNDKEKLNKLKEAVKKLKEATKFHAGGEVIFKKDSEVPGFEADLKSAGVKFTKEKVV